ncbi:hypothetical protein [Saccharothrix sp. NRRL B-16314]|uniref:hypothetical protein n=1 Tax=Saccharothrix sp. NRRL B-16314 TaxID=1463825 RepID=UPI000527EDED|nr:hypothetical protein [Saccharothrix sp. NRRL B-16314]
MSEPLAVPAPLLLLVAVLALVAVVMLWKLLMVAGLIGLAQWAVITQTEDPTAVLVVVGVPALVLAVLLRRAASRTGPRAGLFPRSARRLEVIR